MAGPGGLGHPFVRPERADAVPLVGPFGFGRLRDAPEPPVVLDVRPPAERAVARFQGAVEIPLAELGARTTELPGGRPIVVVDQFGNGARRGAALLQARGRDAAALEGGLDEFARLVDPTLPRYPAGLADGRLLLRQLPRPETGCLAYLAADPDGHEAVLIDPGIDPEPYLALLAADGLTLRAIVETHTHADHLAGHAPLHARTGATIWTGARSPAQYPHAKLAEGDAIEFGAEHLGVLETPGHTRDHLSLTLRDHVFTGDTLLLGSCGRTDLGDGSPELLWESLTEKLLRLPDATEVLPAHYGKRHALPDRYASTIGFERATNEALTTGSHDAFLRYMTDGWPPKPADFDRIVRANLDPF